MLNSFKGSIKRSNNQTEGDKMKSAQIKRYKIVRNGTVINDVIAANKDKAKSRACADYGSNVTVREDLFYKPTARDSRL